MNIEKAIQLAYARHEGQWRDDASPLPYITHVLEVVTNLRYVGGVTDEEMWCVAALHDLLEATDTQASEIEDLFGQRVASLVRELTRTEPTPQQTEGLSKEEIRELRSSLLLEDVRRMSSDAQAIKLADRLSNLRQASVIKKGKKLTRYLAQTERILDAIEPSVNERLHRAVRQLVAQAS